MSLQSWVSQRFGFVSPVRMSLRDVFVEIDVEDLDDIVDAYFFEVDRKYTMTKTGDALDMESLKKYFSTLITLRIDHVLRGKAYRQYDLRQYSVPSFLAAYLLGIGKAEDHEFGLRLLPQATKAELLDPEQMKKMSTMIRALRDAFRPVDFPMDREGNVEFMSKFTLGKAVQSYRARDHVVSAFLSSVIQKTIRDEVILQLSTVIYGDVQVFRKEIPISELSHAEPNLEKRKPQDEVVPQPLGV